MCERGRGPSAARAGKPAESHVFGTANGLAIPQGFAG